MTNGRRGARPDTHYVQSPDGYYIAYQVFGEGPDLLFLTNWLTNIDAMWDEPSVVRFFDRLSSFARVIVLDKRGSGVSDPPPMATILPIQDTLDDARIVLDAVDSDSVALLGDTEGGLMAIMLAATYPERFSSLVLVNSLARFRRADDYPIGAPESIYDVIASKYTDQHGRTGAMLADTAPSVADDPRFRAWWTRYQRLSLPMGAVAQTFRWLFDVDVRPGLASIHIPTLVVHRRDAIYHRLDFGRYLADHIDGAQLRIVEGADTLPFNAGDFTPTLDEVEQFLTGKREIVDVDRMLATVMFTDIIGSTARAAALGDEGWLDLLGAHDRIVRTELERFRGREVRMTGDGCLATFDGPVRAVHCAMEIASAVRGIGIDVRAGIHSGEIEMRNGELGGLAVHIASRVMDQAETGGVLVSSTVKDLVVGSDLDFVLCGAFDLKGVPGEWQLYEVVAT